jgi:hypothetical protein
MAKDEFAAVTPGEMLNEEFLAEYGLSQNQPAKTIGISPNRIAEIVNNRRRGSPRKQLLRQGPWITREDYGRPVEKARRPGIPD